MAVSVFEAWFSEPRSTQEQRVFFSGSRAPEQIPRGGELQQF